MRLLIVEDDAALREILAKRLMQEGYAVDESGDGNEGLQYALNTPYDGLILDIMLPGIDGLTLLKHLRARGASCGVLLLTARDAVDDRVRGLDCGADDFEAEDDVFTVYTDPDDFNAVADAMTQKGYSFVSAQIEMVPQNYQKLTDPEQISLMEKLLDIMDDDDDVQNVWHNWDND